MSEAEEALRLKAEAALRRVRPDARIIHELVLAQGCERIDIAAVWDDGLIVAELKSERDTLKRLPAQLRAALTLRCEVWLCFAPRWRAKVDSFERSHLYGDEHKVVEKRNAEGRVISWSYPKNPDYMPELWRATIAWETPDGLALPPSRREVYPPADGAAMLHMLWADELRAIRGAHPPHLLPGSAPAASDPAFIGLAP